MCIFSRVNATLEAAMSVCLSIFLKVFYGTSGYFGVLKGTLGYLRVLKGTLGYIMYFK